VLTTLGSLGDLHPYLAVALGLQARGHEAVIATSEYHRDKVESAGLRFHPVRPDLPEPSSNPELVRQIMDSRRGPDAVIRGFVMPALRDSYEDTLGAAEGADLLVSHPLTYTTRLVAEKRHLPWASSMLAPLGFFSAFDPPVLPAAQFFNGLRWLGPAFHGPLFALARWSVRTWTDPWRHLRAEIGLPPIKQDVLFDGQHSPFLVLAMFSAQLGTNQPDWPRQTVITGCPFFDHGFAPGQGLSSELLRFLEDGEPPIVFTLGSSAVHDAGAFYQHSAEATRRLRRRAVLLVGKDPRNRPASLPAGVLAFDYAPFADLFPRAAAVVHQGGVGTTTEAMRAGKPMIVVPFAHDQPDNAARMVRLGIARTISRHRYTVAAVVAELRRILENPAYARRAAEVGRRVRSEDGVRASCDALEALLRARGQS
jgi:UDP:flavonoid glycosyltransferase YjiC (YdhE family)